MTGMQNKLFDPGNIEGAGIKVQRILGKKKLTEIDLKFLIAAVYFLTIVQGDYEAGRAVFKELEGKTLPPVQDVYIRPDIMMLLELFKLKVFELNEQFYKIFFKDISNSFLLFSFYEEHGKSVEPVFEQIFARWLNEKNREEIRNNLLRKKAIVLYKLGNQKQGQEMMKSIADSAEVLGDIKSIYNNLIMIADDYYKLGMQIEGLNLLKKSLILYDSPKGRKGITPRRIKLIPYIASKYGETDRELWDLIISLLKEDMDIFHIIDALSGMGLFEQAITLTRNIKQKNIQELSKLLISILLLKGNNLTMLEQVVLGLKEIIIPYRAGRIIYQAFFDDDEKLVVHPGTYQDLVELIQKICTDDYDNQFQDDLLVSICVALFDQGLKSEAQVVLDKIKDKTRTAGILLDFAEVSFLKGEKQECDRLVREVEALFSGKERNNKSLKYAYILTLLDINRTEQGLKFLTDNTTILSDSIWFSVEIIKKLLDIKAYDYLQSLAGFIDERHLLQSGLSYFLACFDCGEEKQALKNWMFCLNLL